MTDEKVNRPENDPPRRERTKPEDLRDWEVVQQNDNDYIERLRIVGGWLYRTVVRETNAVAMVFVPASD